MRDIPVTVLAEYIVTSFIVSLFAGIGEKIAPQNMKKYITFVASLMLLIFLVSPLKSIGEEILLLTDEMVKEEESTSPPSANYDEILKLAERKAEEAIQKHVSDAFALKDALSVSLAMKMEDSGTVLITQIALTLGAKDSDLADDIRVYSEKTFHTATKVMIAEEE